MRWTKYVIDIEIRKLDKGVALDWQIWPDTRLVQEAVSQVAYQLKSIFPLINPQKNGKVTVFPEGGPMVDNVKFDVAMMLQAAVRKARDKMRDTKKRNGTVG